MKVVRRKVILILSLLMILYLGFSPFISKNLNKFYLKNMYQRDYLTDYQVIENQFIIELNIQEFKSFSHNFSLFGYRLVAEDINPIDWDQAGLLTLSQNKLNFVDVSLNLKWGEYIYKNLPIYGKLIVDIKNNQEYCYHIEDPHRGFFMEMIISTNISYIDLAFDGGDCQLCYNGLLPQGYTTFKTCFTQIIDVIHLNIIKQISPFSFAELEQNIKESQRNNIKIYQRDTYNVDQRGRITFTDYGIAHEVADFPTVNLAEDLPDNYWEPYSEIDIGIYRSEPSEQQIKSDLQYYNRDQLQLWRGYVRNIKEYAVYAHGAQEKNGA